MIDDGPSKCDGCGKMKWILICDSPRKKYFCTECCDDVGHQPPFSDEEFEALQENVW